MGQIWEYIRIAMMNITSNKGRSFLTMLGIIIGISSVIMIISIGNGVRGEINSELNSIGGGQIYVYVENGDADNYITFKADDLDFIKERVDHVKGVTIQYGASGLASSSKGEINADVTSGTADMQYTFSDPLVRGRYFSEDDYLSGNRVCVISESGAMALFGHTDVVGLSFDLNLYGVTQEMMVVGVRQDNSSMMINMMMGGYRYMAVEMPATVLSSSYGYWIEEFNNILIVADSPSASAEVARRTVQVLESKYDVRGQNMIMVESFADASAQADSILGMVTLFISMVAAISLLVGGIGVMNIMLVSVTERTREIGIRKALGARTGSILTQFLAEAGIITLIGGIIGIILGFLGAVLVCSLLDFNAQVDGLIVLLATVFSSAVGIFFGIYPARKAARLSPIEALRHE
ncbi:MAG: ABC transporter permease [Lachnospiraceae bacterium]|jgi:putative ABC transport system permease protein|nr:ABC transporter permease [Lachnospiraceae bacterium]